MTGDLMVIMRAGGGLFGLRPHLPQTPNVFHGTFYNQSYVYKINIMFINESFKGF